ncbi:hypothetical protein KGM_214435 [Danaus plexippus plexippus]|uniref:Uncharacterized protein n=1 Tax=Danaus plexippus plexippus TaxID=278856 RepID=A0A212EWP3_DANPL|nr:hypothetical protein KGM_214435 [Danaus plexippus plexippus]
MHPTDRHGALDLNLNNDLMLKTIQELCCHGAGFTVDHILHGRAPAASDSDDEERGDTLTEDLETGAQLQQKKPLLKFSVSAILGEDADSARGPGGREGSWGITSVKFDEQQNNIYNNRIPNRLTKTWTPGDLAAGSRCDNETLKLQKELLKVNRGPSNIILRRHRS